MTQHLKMFKYDGKSLEVSQAYKLLVRKYTQSSCINLKYLSIHFLKQKKI